MANLTATKNSERGPKLGNLIKFELFSEHGYCREVVNANLAAEATYDIGTVVGEVTATGNYVISDSAATDGSEVPAGIVIEKVDIPATTDTELVILKRGPAGVADGALILDASWDGSEADVYEALESLGIAVRKQI